MSVRGRAQFKQHYLPAVIFGEGIINDELVCCHQWEFDSSSFVLQTCRNQHLLEFLFLVSSYANVKEDPNFLRAELSERYVK